MVNTPKKTYKYIKNHYRSWFLDLPGYAGWNKRLRRILDAFPDLIEHIIRHLPGKETACYDLLDSLPIKIARGSRSSRARVASPLANKGYCDSQDEWYYGVKLHLQASAKPGKLPIPKLGEITSASTHDLSAWRSNFFCQENQVIYGDRAYINKDLQEDLGNWQQVSLRTPHKKKKGQHYLSLFQQVDNTNHSKIRQPIDALFAWLGEKTGIQNASKVRSTSGLFLHIWGKLAACMIIMLIFNC